MRKKISFLSSVILCVAMLFSFSSVFAFENVDENDKPIAVPNQSEYSKIPVHKDDSVSIAQPICIYSSILRS